MNMALMQVAPQALGDVTEYLQLQEELTAQEQLLAAKRARIKELKRKVREQQSMQPPCTQEEYDAAIQQFNAIQARNAELKQLIEYADKMMENLPGANSQQE